jgi:hypothetical protein
MARIPCRPLPLWLRIPKAIAGTVVLVVAVILFFTVCPWFEIGSGK